MKVELVPLEWVNRTWGAVAGYIDAAFKESKADYTLDQAQAYVAQGNWALIIAVEEDKIVGAATVNLYNRPNARVAFVTAIGGKMIATQEAFDQLKQIAGSLGATVIEGAARESIARLWKRFGFEEKHRIVGVQI